MAATVWQPQALRRRGWFASAIQVDIVSDVLKKVHDTSSETTFEFPDFGAGQLRAAFLQAGDVVTSLGFVTVTNLRLGFSPGIL